MNMETFKKPNLVSIKDGVWTFRVEAAARKHALEFVLNEAGARLRELVGCITEPLIGPGKPLLDIELVRCAIDDADESVLIGVRMTYG
jgi:hypothetical protein